MTCNFCGKEKDVGVAKQPGENIFICDTCIKKADSLIKDPVLAPFKHIYIDQVTQKGEPDARQ